MLRRWARWSIRDPRSGSRPPHNVLDAPEERAPEVGLLWFVGEIHDDGWPRVEAEATLGRRMEPIACADRQPPGPPAEVGICGTGLAEFPSDRNQVQGDRGDKSRVPFRPGLWLVGAMSAGRRGSDGRWCLRAPSEAPQHPVEARALAPPGGHRLHGALGSPEQAAQRSDGSHLGNLGLDKHRIHMGLSIWRSAQHVWARKVSG